MAIGCDIVYRYGTASHGITVFQERQPGTSWWMMDGRRGEQAAIDLEATEGYHRAEVHVYETTGNGHPNLFTHTGNIRH